jgi:hypothetical protein
MYLLWLALLVVLLLFSIRTVPYLEGMIDKGKEVTKPEGYDITLKNPTASSLMVYSDDPKDSGMDDLKEIYGKKTKKEAYTNYESPKISTLETDKGVYTKYDGKNLDVTVTPTGYTVDTNEGTYGGYKGPTEDVPDENRHSYKIETDKGTYAGYKGPNVQATLTPDGYSVTGPKRTYYSSCTSTMYGCCPNGKDPKIDENGSNCEPDPSPAPTSCAGTTYGCCPDELTAKVDANGSNCASYPPCAGSTFGCCPDGKTPKKDYVGSNCIPPAPSCGGSTFGCCPDGKTAKTDYLGSNCVPPPPLPSPSPSPAPTACTGSSYGCCPDQLTAKVDANGSNCAAYPSNGMIDLQPIRKPELDAYNTSTVFLSPPRKESTCPEPQPCPPCARCPEPSFDCKKVPNYSSTNSGHLPVPILNDFSQFGM